MLYGLKQTREIEDRIENKLYKQGLVYGGVYTSKGQEAISIGSIHAFRPDDVICPSHRDMGVFLTRGMSKERILGHYLGKVTGPSKGKDGNLHTGDINLGLISFISHLADNIPVATGVSLSFKLRKQNRVAAVYFGDGASSRGDFHEAVNFAAVHKLPIVFFCNNNQYAYSTPLEHQMAVDGVSERAKGYGFPTLKVDGNDLLAVYRASVEAVDRARSGQGPSLIESMTFRMTGHSGHDDASYVPPELFEEWAQKDPIENFTNFLLERNLITPTEIKKIDERVEAEIEAALQDALHQADPNPESTLTDVYASPPYHAEVPTWKKTPEDRIQIDSLEPAPLLETSSPPDKGEITYVEAINKALEEELDHDPDVFLLGEDIGTYGGAFKVTKGLLDRFGPERVIDAPIAEAEIVGAGIGAALQGMRPVLEMQFIDFISCGFDQITNFAAKSKYRWGAQVPLVVRGPCGGGVNGGPFHSQNVESYFLHTPGLKIVAPATAEDAHGLLKAAIRDDDPVLYFEHKYLYRRVRGYLPGSGTVAELGKAAIRRPGKDLTIITYGAMVYRALEAAQELEKDGASIEVLDLRTLLPLDVESILESTARTSKVILLHEATLTGGLGGELAALISEHAFEYLDGPLRRIAGPDTPVPFCKPLEDYFLPQVCDIKRVARELLDY